MSYDISKLYIPILNPTDGLPLVEVHSELQAFPEFHRCDDWRIKIAVLSSDIDSPFVRIKERETMVKAIFDYLDLKDPVLMEAVIKYKDDLTNLASLRYLQILHETDFTDLILARKDYDFFLQKANESKEEKESDEKYLERKNKLRKTIKDLGQEVRAIEAKIFPDSKAAREAMLAESKSKIALFAEKYAESNTYI